MKRPGSMFGRQPEDPGVDWADDLLAPLRRQIVACDVAPGVMQRIAAGRPLAPATPFTAPPRLAWAGSLFLGFAALALLITTLVLLIGGSAEGLRALWTVLEPAARLAILFAQQAAKLATVALGATVAVVSSSWGLVTAAAPYVRGAGLIAAGWGLMTVFISTYLFAHARRTAPIIGLRSDIPLQGGPR